MLLTDMEVSTPEPASQAVPDRISRDVNKVSHDPFGDVTRPPDTSHTSRDTHNTQRVTSPQRSDQSLTDTIVPCLQRHSSDNLDGYSDITMTNDSDQCLGDNSDHNICHDTGANKSRRNLRRRQKRRNLPERSRQKRQTLQDMTRLLKQWLYHHKDNPYPTKAEKLKLAVDSQLSLTQVSNWFANARRRLKNTVKDPTLSWGRRIKVYNNHVTGNAELLSISSSDSMWESENEDEATKQDGKAAAVHEDPRNSQTTPAQRSQELQASSTPIAHSTIQLLPPAGPNVVNSSGQKLQTFTASGNEVNVVKTGFDATSSETQICDQGHGLISGQVNGTNNTKGHLNPIQSLQAFSGPTVHQCGTRLSILAPIQSQGHTQLDRVPGVSPTKTVSSMEGVIPSVTGSPFSPQQHKLFSPLQCDDVTRDGAVSPKYKQTILQRYLHDSCTHSFQIPLSPPSGDGRHRHPSGSVGSHDYEEISSSSRSSPVAMAMADVSSQEDDLYWLEISAAMALTTLARSRAKNCE